MKTPTVGLACGDGPLPDDDSDDCPPLRKRAHRPSPAPGEGTPREALPRKRRLVKRLSDDENDTNGEETAPSAQHKKSSRRTTPPPSRQREKPPPRRQAAKGEESVKQEELMMEEEEPKPPARKRGGAKAEGSKPAAARKKKASDQAEGPSMTTKLNLEGLRIVLTGVFDTCSREEMTDHVKRLGGTCTTAVSGVTDILVVGSALEDGRSVEEGKKYQKAQKIQTQGVRSKPAKLVIMKEDEFLSKYPLRPAAVEAAAASTAEQHPVVAEVAALVTAPPEAKESVLLATTTVPGGDSALWTEKWRPRQLGDILGNGEVVRKLTTWLRDWRDVCILGKQKTPPAAKMRGGGRFAEAERINARAALLSGPPGVGKTTTAKVVAEECGYDVLEFNASDDRGKHIIEVLSDMTSGGSTLDSYLLKTAASRRTVLVMDEVDGLSKGDRGGAPALIKLIERSQCPVVCMCNDRYNPKVSMVARTMSTCPFL